MDENVHKDFHGAMSFGIEFLEKECGREGLEEFLAGLADTVYKGLVEDIRKRGLAALEDHWRRIMDVEEAEYELSMDDDTLVLEVRTCPAVHHMKTHDYRVATSYCEHTRIVNEAVCRAAGYEATVDYNQDEGRCVQRFRRAEA